MQPATGITEITFLPDLGRTPATVNKKTGQLYISRRHWQKMNPDQRLFMILHEMGHVVLQSSDEVEVDQWAFDQYKKTGRSLKNSVKALTGVLSGKSPEHHTRAMLQLQRAIQEENLSNPAKNEAMHTNAPINPSVVGILGAKYMSAAPGHNLPEIHISSEDDFENKSGRRAARQERKKIKAESKAEKRVIKAEGKAYKKKSVGDANVILAQQGINARAGLAKEILGGAAKVAGAVGGSVMGTQLVQQLPGLIGGGQQSNTDPGLSLGGEGGFAENIANTAANTAGALASKMMQPSTFEPTNPNAMRIDPNFQGMNPVLTPAPEEEKKSNTMLYIGIGAVVLVVVLMIFLKK